MLAVLLIWGMAVSIAGNQGSFPDACSPESQERITWVKDHIRIQYSSRGERYDLRSFDHNEPLSLNLKIKEIENTWYCKIRMDIAAANLPDALVPGQDSLYMVLLTWKDGETSVSGDEKAPIPDPVQAVAHINRSLHGLQDDEWADIQTRTAGNGLNWIGLHDRYHAFVLLLDTMSCKSSSHAHGQRSAHLGQHPFIPVEDSHTGVGVAMSLGQTRIWSGDTLQCEFLVFLGPKSTEALHGEYADLRPLLFSGLWSWMRWICFGILGLLGGIHYLIPNWGWAIIVLAFVVRVLLFPLAKRAFISQRWFIQAQEKMKPELAEIKTKYKGGEQSEMILQLYKKHHVSPFAGLKPMMIILVQLPILIALYHVLGTAYELHNAHFLWIETLSEPDKLFAFGFHIPWLGAHFNLLPFVMSFVTLLSFKLSPMPADGKQGQRTQSLFLLGMTVVFFLLFYAFPSGMVLYWTFANVFHLVQHKYFFQPAT